VSKIPPGITEQDVREALKLLDGGIKHEFGRSTAYDLVESGRRYPPKAVLGLAAVRILNRSLKPRDFRGGDDTECFRILQELGFTIQRRSDGEPAERISKNDWTDEEVRALLDDHFAMLELQAGGVHYSKTDHRRRLLGRIPARSESAIEFKHRNVSAVLDSLGLQTLVGYRPAKHFQQSLVMVVAEYLDKQQKQLLNIERLIASIPMSPQREVDFASCEVPPPQAKKPGGMPSPSQPRISKLYDFAKRDAENHKLGEAGERFAVDWEMWHLRSVGRSDLAECVDWISKTQGDGAGYDIVSHDPADGDRIYIEVKTTNCGSDFPFYVSVNEVEASARLGSRYRLYRLFNFSAKPQLYRITGALSSAFDLTAKLFEARRRRV
jgi:hypothetical protein